MGTLGASQEPCLVALELMKFGVLSGEPFDAATPDRPFPAEVLKPSCAALASHLELTPLLCEAYFTAS
eukprot:2620490-Amphidinium_carterae.2